MIVARDTDWFDQSSIIFNKYRMLDEKEDVPLVSKRGKIVVVFLSIIFFVFMGWFVLRHHVPSENETVVNIVAFMTSFCITGVFWIAANMFLVTLVDFQRSKKN